MGPEFVEEAVDGDRHDTTSALVLFICSKVWFTISISGPPKLNDLPKMADFRCDVLATVVYLKVNAAIDEEEV